MKMILTMKKLILNYKNRLNSFISEINNRKLMHYINDISNNAEVHKQDITL